MTKSYRPILALAVLLILVGLACTLTDTISPRTSDIPERGETVLEELPLVQAPETMVAPEFLDYPGLAEGMAGLNSYSSSFLLAIVGQREGQPLNQQLDIREQIVRPQSGQRLVMEVSGESVVTSRFEIIRIGNQAYISGIEGLGGQCIAATSNDEDPFIGYGGFRAEDVLGNFQSDQLLQRGEIVNGVHTDRYRLKQAYVGLGVSFQSGEVWIAQDGGYVVRYIGQGEITRQAFLIDGPVDEGVVAWEYNLRDINALAAIDVPQACLDAAQRQEDIPVPNDALNLTTFAGMISFTSPESVTDLAEFYREELMVNGWQISDTLVTDTTVILTAAKDEQLIQVLINAGEGETTVMITTQ